MSDLRVLITTAYLFPGDEVDTKLKAAGIEVSYGAPKTLAEGNTTLAEALHDVDAVIAGTEPFGADAISSAANLKIIARTGVGYDSVDVDAATSRGIAVAITPGSNRISVAEHVLALMLNCARLIPQNIESVKSGTWPQKSGRELSGATLGLIGLGSIGKAVARLALAFGMDVIAYDPYMDENFLTETGVRAVPLDVLMRESDFVSPHIFLDETTRHLIGTAALATMKPTAYVINTSRGGVVDENALALAVKTGALAGAALDVVESEPLPSDSALRGVDNILITAHIAGATGEARLRAGLAAADAVINLLNDQPAVGIVNSGYVDNIKATVQP
jgi:D-3-phosphoglycerate dehydrogenase